MQIVVASGKGGTGKTTVAVSLALALIEELGPGQVWLVDADVEAPNAHLFLHPDLDRREEFAPPVPKVDLDLCTGCGRCGEVCQFHAIVAFPAAEEGQRPTVLVFDDLCHSCGGCALECPENAIREVPHRTGVIEFGRVGPLQFMHGLLDVGKAMATPLIGRLKQSVENVQGVVLIDAPPGTACSVVNSMHGADFVLLVTEPTPFGLHDLRLAIEVSRELGLEAGVVINRDGIGDAGVEDYCAEQGLPILLRIPYDRRIAEAYARGQPLLQSHPEYKEPFLQLYRQILAEVDR
ncbi:MAG: ATP-binding protein [Chloroflexia bacterium]|nr:ATP-binding protein [Chloroflexia bacterium]